MLKRRFWVIVAIAVIAFNIFLAFPVKAQLPVLPEINWQTFKLNQNPENIIVSACVRLDGRCIFRILDQKSNISQRIKYTEERLKNISQVYFAREDAELKVYSQSQGSQEDIYLEVGNYKSAVITLYNRDAATRGVNLDHQAQQIVRELRTGLKVAKQQRQRPFLIKQAQFATIFTILMIIGNFILLKLQKRIYDAHEQLTSEEFPFAQPLGVSLRQKQQLDLYKIQYRIFQVIQGAIWLGGILFILSLFPYTRPTQLWIVTLLRIPLRIGVVSLATYILIRLSYVLIAKFNRSFTENYVLNRDTRRRMQLRITTIARLLGGTITLFWIILGVVVALTIIGFNVTPLLAGAGILGLAFSFASQNLIKDAINGFFIILEDQYAVGDVINLGTVSGLVENLNLRITQLRDGQGRLITIPNSEIKIVANLSSQWSRAEIDIPVAYETDIDYALKSIEQVAQQMSEETEWYDKIIEPPQVLGVDSFSDRGSVVRIWIKTEPLKQWEVSREFRRRLQNAFEKEGISLPLTQQQIVIRDRPSSK
ncbi:MAG: hypothetical protein Tsb0014_18300 [Pleurocapsa sp.]